MPNCVAGVIRLEGPDQEVERFKTENRTDTKPLSFKCFLPVPKTIRGENAPADILVPGERDWCVATWGTKWDCITLSPDWGDDKDGKPHALRFWTAWDAAIPYFLAVSKAYPDLTFHYSFIDEGGWHHNIGSKVIRNGVCVTTVLVTPASEAFRALEAYVGSPYEAY